MAKDNKTIGKFHLDGLPPAQRGVPQIEVTFDIDANGILQVSAKDKATGKSHNIRIEAKSGLTEDEIEKMVQEAEANAESDQKQRELIESRNFGESQINSVRNDLSDVKDKLTEDEITKIEEAIEDYGDVDVDELPWIRPLTPEGVRAHRL